MVETSTTIFREVQKFRQIWIWIIILIIAGFSWYAVIQQILLKIPFGSRPAPDAVLLIAWVIFGIGFPALFLSSKLITEVRSDGLYIRLFPFHFSFQKIPLEEIKRYEVRTYRPFKEYGGWGIRYGPKGKAYNVSGNRGVQLELVNGKRVLIGSQKPEELAHAIEIVLGKR